MTDYNKLTVVVLRGLLKERGITSTGLTKKAQIIQRLEEVDKELASEASSVTVQGEVTAAPIEPLTAPANEEAIVEDEQAEPPDAAPAVVPEERVESAPEVPEEPVQSAPEAPVDVQAPASSSGAISAPIPTASSVMATPEDSAHTAKQDLSLTSQTPIPSTEKPPLAPPTQIDAESLSLSHVASLESDRTEEMAEDRKKRKRRSATPPLDSSEIAKKRKHEEMDTTVHLKEDVVAGGGEQEDTAVASAAEVEMPDAAQEDENVAPAPDKVQAADGEEQEDTVEASAAEVDMPDAAQEDENVAPAPDKVQAADGEEQEDTVEASAAEVEMPDAAQEDENVAPAPDKAQEENVNLENERPTQIEERPTLPREAEDDEPRHRRHPLSNVPLASKEPLHEIPLNDERDVEPSLHPATRALYIRDLKRPIQQNQLCSHLNRVASGKTSGKDDVLETFFLDKMRTHAFAVFDTISQASRARSALHGRPFPDERDRGPVWVDFAPEEKIDTWISVEQKDGGREMKKWEVVYEEEGGSMMAFLQEAGGLPPPRPAKRDQKVYDRSPPLRRDTEQEVRPRVAPLQAKETGQRILALEKLFESTEAKPKLYYLPVSEGLAKRRLDELAKETSCDWKGDETVGEDEYNRYGFEDGDLLINRGHHNARGSRGRRGGGMRGGRGGFRP